MESSNICTRMASFLPPPRECCVTADDPSTPDGVLSECVIRLPGSPFVFDVPSEFNDMILYFTLLLLLLI
jgi:hypothetical protein